MQQAENAAQQIKQFHEVLENIERQIAVDMVGQRGVIREVLIALVSGGNVLLEGVPGLGKTRLVRTLGRVLELPFSRIQFTPDLMPADVVGTNLVMQDATGSRFEFQPGPLFASLVLADEINRATPKTQSALLEAMQEGTVTVAGQTRPLPKPFFVLATQNPLEQEGTYPLPEAQLDRFFFKIQVPFPTLEELRGIVDLTGVTDEAAAQKAADAQTLLSLRQVAGTVPAAAAVQDYALRLVLATHPGEGAPEVVNRAVRYGASPRAAQVLLRAARVRALMEGRFNVAFEDVDAVALPALRHRVFLNFDGIAEGLTPEVLIAQLLPIVRQGEGHGKH